MEFYTDIENMMEYLASTLLREQLMQEMPNRATDPTPEEIAEKCSEIRQGWTPEDFLRRRGILCPREYQGEWLPPIVKPPKFDSN